MRPLLAIVIALTLVAVAAAVGLFAGEHRPPGDAASPAPAATVSASAPAKATVAPAAKARAGRVLPLPDAIRELELIKPARSKRAEDFSLNTPSSGKVRLLDYRGQVVLINFWATWCPPCLEEMPAMERLYRQHRELGFTLVAVSVDADSKLVAPFVTAHKFTFPVALDPEHEHGQHLRRARAAVDASSWRVTARWPRWPSGPATGTTTPPTRSSRAWRASMRGSVGVLVAFSAGLFSFLSPCVLPLFPSYLSFITGMSVADLSKDLTATARRRVMIHAVDVRGRLLGRVRRAGGVVQRRGAAVARVPRLDPPDRRSAHHPLRPVHRRAAEDRHVQPHAAVADPREAGRLRGLVPRRRHVRHRLDAVRGPDPGRHSLAGRDRRDGRSGVSACSWPTRPASACRSWSRRSRSAPS